MKTSLTAQQFLRMAAVVLVALIAALAVIHGRSAEEAVVLTPLERGGADGLVGELARCRTIAPDDAEVLDACRRIWAENRQHFFLSTKSPRLPAASAPSESTGSLMSEDPVLPQGTEQGRAR